MNKIFAFCFILFSSSTYISAQCYPVDDTENFDGQVESWYKWAKDWENYAIDQFPISERDEMLIGDSLHLTMAKENVLLKTHPKKRKVEQIVANLAKSANRKSIKYTVHIIDDNKTLNAFSIAGGHVYVTSKILDWVESDDELAFILAHEVAHVDNKHSVRKAQKLLIGEMFLGDYGILAANLEMLLSSPFGQIDEYDADRSGAVLAVKAGYNPRKGLRFFEKMSKDENYDYIEKIMRTHPYSAERHNCLDHFMREKLNK
ncbi:MAG: M48 family metallopeptidase [Chitinophagales bacterium]